MKEVYQEVNKLLSITAILFVVLLTSCDSSKPTERPSFEKPKFIIQLDETKLLVSEIERDLDEPWEITWGADEQLWYTEKKGNVYRMNPTTGQSKKVLFIPDVYYGGLTPGLLGMVVHPDFNKEPYVYMHYTYMDTTVTAELSDGRNTDFIKSKLVRYVYDSEKDTLINPEFLLPEIPGFRAHNGSRLTISEDNKLLFIIGDVADSKNAQTEYTLPGKVLRLNLDGTVPDDNPIPGNYFYTMGHRNPQGLVAANGKIYASEHGPDNDDEINIIKPSGNYGWPFVEGYCDKENEKTFCDTVAVIEPIYAWTPTIAPAGLDYYNHTAIPEWKNNLMLTTLKGRALWLFELDETGEEIVNKRIYLQKAFGRLRDLCVSNTGDVYLITSNSDWHIDRYKWMYDSVPEDGNDRIIKISVLQKDEEVKYADLEIVKEDVEAIPMMVQESKSKEGRLYSRNCASCHMRRGEGIPGFTPPLIGTATVADKYKLIETVLFGKSGEIVVKGKKYNEVMPGFAASLTNEELKELLDFVRGKSNHTDSISVAEIEKIRKSRTF